MLCEGQFAVGTSVCTLRVNACQRRFGALARPLNACAGSGDAGRDDYGGGRERRRGYGFGEGGFDDDRGGGGFGRERSRGGGFADSYGRDRGGGGSFADSYGRDRGGPNRDAPDAGGRGYGFRCAARWMLNSRPFGLVLPPCAEHARKDVRASTRPDAACWIWAAEA